MSLGCHPKHFFACLRPAWLIAPLTFLCLLRQNGMAQSIYAPDRILVQPRVGTTAGSLARFHAAQKARVLRTLDGIGRLQILALPDGAAVPSFIASYQRSGLVEFAEPDYLVQAALTPNDPKYVDGTT